MTSLEIFDDIEAAHRDIVLEWIDSGAGLFRVEKPATPSPHLVSYFVLVDCNAGQLLLVDHINARLWLPSGGHVEPDEHPRVAAEREAAEELGIEATFLFQEPLFLTVSETVGLTAGHTDVSLWFVVAADSTLPITFDRSEFHTVRWFGFDQLPYERADPNLRRFVRKLRSRLALNPALRPLQTPHRGY